MTEVKLNWVKIDTYQIKESSKNYDFKHDDCDNDYNDDRVVQFTLC